MAIMSSRLIRHEICKDELKAMGARVLDIQGIMFYVKFNINGNKISYIYHLKPDNTYFMERIKPYTMPIGDYNTEEEIVDLIKIDIEQFNNAMKSHNFDSFIKVDNNISKLVRIFEDLYLYYNISEEDIKGLNDEVKGVLEHIKDIKKKSERVYFKKEPDMLCNDLEF